MTFVWLALWSLLPALLPGWSAQAVLSDSMAPSIRRGDVVLTSPADDPDLAPPEVAVYRSDRDGELVTHRIVERLDDGTVVTRGDANPADDPTPVHAEQVVGVGRLLVPLVGHPSVWLAERDHLRLGLTVVAAIVLFAGARAAWMPARRPVRTDGEGRRARPRSPALASTTAHRLVVGAALVALLPVASLSAGPGERLLAGWWPAPTEARFTATTDADAAWATGTWLTWWHDDYAARLPLTVTTGPQAPHGGYEGYTVRTHLDTAALIAQGQLRSDCADLRVTHWGGSTWTELDRLVEGCGSSETEVVFALSGDLPDDAADDAYWLHVGNPDAGQPPADPAAVWLLHDDFSGDTPGQPPTGWSGDEQWVVVEDEGRNVLRLAGTGNPGGGQGGGQGGGGAALPVRVLQADGLEERDVHVEARMRGELVNGQEICVATRMRGGAGGDLQAGCVTQPSGNARDLQLLRAVDGAVQVLADTPGAWDDTAWQRLGTGSVGEALRLEHDGVPVLTSLDPQVQAPGSVGLRASTRNRDLDVDEVVVRRAATVEPTVEVGGLEQRD